MKNSYLYDTKTNIKYYTKYELRKDNSVNVNNIIYKPSNGFWDTINWKVEPSKSFDELKTERAFQLRDKYKYLILYFSGGGDSNTVLNTFLKNKIFIDEIRLNSYDFTTNSKILFPSYDLIAYNYLQKIEKYIPKTKIIYNRITPRIFLDFIVEDHHKKVYDAGFVNKIARTPLSDFPSKFNYGKYQSDDYGFIMCEFKPSLRIGENNKYYAVLFSTAVLTKSLSWDYFFTTSDLPELHIKQCYMLKNYLKIDFKEYFESYLGYITESKKSSYKYLIRKICRDIGDYRSEVLTTGFSSIKPTKDGKDYIITGNHETVLLSKELKASDKYVYSVWKSLVLDTYYNTDLKKENYKVEYELGY